MRKVFFLTSLSFACAALTLATSVGAQQPAPSEPAPPPSEPEPEPAPPSDVTPPGDSAPPEAAPPPPAAAPATVMRGGGARIAGFVTLGVGAAGMATFAAAGLMANGRYKEISDACGGKRCTDPSFADKIDGGRRLDIIANVGLGVGIAGLAVGTLLVALGGPKAVPATSAWIMPSGGGLVAGGTF